MGFASFEGPVCIISFIAWRAFIKSHFFQLGGYPDIMKWRLMSAWRSQDPIKLQENVVVTKMVVPQQMQNSFAVDPIWKSRNPLQLHAWGLSHPCPEPRSTVSGEQKIRPRTERTGAAAWFHRVPYAVYLTTPLQKELI